MPLGQCESHPWLHFWIHAPVFSLTSENFPYYLASSTINLKGLKNIFYPTFLSEYFNMVFLHNYPLNFYFWYILRDRP